MKIQSTDDTPVRFTWICSRCKGEDFEQIDDETCRCTTCGRLFTADILDYENRDRIQECYIEFEKAVKEYIAKRWGKKSE